MVPCVRGDPQLAEYVPAYWKLFEKLAKIWKYWRRRKIFKIMLNRLEIYASSSKSVLWSAGEAVCNKDWSFEVVLKKVSADNEQRRREPQGGGWGGGGERIGGSKSSRYLAHIFQTSQGSPYQSIAIASEAGCSKNLIWRPPHVHGKLNHSSWCEATVHKLMVRGQGKYFREDRWSTATVSPHPTQPMLYSFLCTLDIYMIAWLPLPALTRWYMINISEYSLTDSGFLRD